MKKLVVMIVLSSCLASSHSSRSFAQDNRSKYEALFLYNFTKYMKWPDQDQIVIGVMGNSPVLLELNAIAKRGSKFRVVKISGAIDVAKCNIIFLPKAQSRNFELIQKGIGNMNILLVTQDSKLTGSGAEVGFFIESEKLKFIINKKELEATQIKVSQSLYGIAKVM